MEQKGRIECSDRFDADTKHFGQVDFMHAEISINSDMEKRKGRDATRNRLKEFLRRYYIKYGHVWYVAQFDIHEYYPNMDHSMTEFRKKLPPDAAEMVVSIIRH